MLFLFCTKKKSFIWDKSGGNPSKSTNKGHTNEIVRVVWRGRELITPFYSIEYTLIKDYKLGIIFLALRNNQVQRTNGMVKAGSPYGKRKVLSPAVIGTVKHAATIPDKSAKRLCSLSKNGRYGNNG